LDILGRRWTAPFAPCGWIQPVIIGSSADDRPRPRGMEAGSRRALGLNPPRRAIGACGSQTLPSAPPALKPQVFWQKTRRDGLTPSELRLVTSPGARSAHPQSSNIFTGPVVAGGITTMFICPFISVDAQTRPSAHDAIVLYVREEIQVPNPRGTDALRTTQWSRVQTVVAAVGIVPEMAAAQRSRRGQSDP
jgi:hypothetical protein